MSLPWPLSFLHRAALLPTSVGEGRHAAANARGGVLMAMPAAISQRRGARHRRDLRCRRTAVTVYLGPVRYEGEYWRRWLP